MPDITMCEDHDCPYKQGCYRYTAKPSPYRQSYFVESPREEDGSCKYYWDMEELKSTKTNTHGEVSDNSK